MDDETLCARLNQLGRLAEQHVAAGTPDTGRNEITHEEADRLIASVVAQGASIEQLRRVLAGDGVFAAYRAPMLRAVEWFAARA
jgi:hypothetical protein